MGRLEDESVAAEAIFEFQGRIRAAPPLYRFRAPVADLPVILEAATETGKIFVDGEETTDVERIGEAFSRWVRSLAP